VPPALINEETVRFVGLINGSVDTYKVEDSCKNVICELPARYDTADYTCPINYECSDPRYRVLA